ncbi:MAG TPA: FCD domain-containing protein [Acidimicrobiales bacterium]|nr:FCD domain-containing protein [Acidimicrobiales bacterium]
MPGPELRHVKRSELLAREIVEEILVRGLQPGDLLPPESVMLEHYRVGRASLREALRVLEMQGLVSMKPGPGGGPVVGAVDATNLGRTASLYFRLDGATRQVLAEAMLILDPWLAELAAERAEPEMVMGVLGPCLQAADGAGGDSERIWRTAPEFHDSVYELSRNGVLKTMASSLGSIFRRQVLSEVELSAVQPRFLDDHHRLTEAISAGRGAQARRIAYEHMELIIETANRNSPGLLDRMIEWN